MATLDGNPLYPSLDDLGRRLTNLNWLIYSLENQLEYFRSATEQSMKRTGHPVGAGAGLNVVDLTVCLSAGWVVRESIGWQGAKGQAYLDTVDMLLAWSAAHTIAQAYEAFETFLQDTVAAFLRHQPDYRFGNAFVWLLRVPVLSQIVRKLEATSRALRKKPVQTTDLEFWKVYVRDAFSGDQKRLLKYVRGLAPDLRGIEKCNYHRVDLLDWHYVAANVRHATTHSNMLLESRKTAKWPKNRMQVLQRFFPGSHERDGYRLKIPRDLAHDNLVIFAEYAKAIYKLLSAKGHFDTTTLLGSKP